MLSIKERNNEELTTLGHRSLECNMSDAGGCGDGCIIGIDQGIQCPNKYLIKTGKHIKEPLILMEISEEQYKDRQNAIGEGSF